MVFYIKKVFGYLFFSVLFFRHYKAYMNILTVLKDLSQLIILQNCVCHKVSFLGPCFQHFDIDWLPFDVDDLKIFDKINKLVNCERISLKSHQTVM